MTSARNSSPASSTAARAAYLVLGMHRSGTSALTQVLALAGAHLPQAVMPGDEHNARGYFEPWRIAVFNDRRLRAGGGAWDDPFAYPYVATEDEAAWETEAQSLFRNEYGRARYPLLKDPRVSILMPLWRPVLEAEGLELRCIIPIRTPLAVAGSLGRRDQFPDEKSVLLWISYMLGAESGSFGLPRAFVDYDRLLIDWRGEVAKMEAALGSALPRLSARAAERIDGFLSAELRHNAGAGDLAALGEIGRTAERVEAWFRSTAADENPSREPLEAAGALLVELKRRMGSFVSPVTRALDLAKSQLAEARGLRDLEAAARREAEAEIAKLRLERQLAEAELDEVLSRI